MTEATPSALTTDTDSEHAIVSVPATMPAPTETSTTTTTSATNAETTYANDNTMVEGSNDSSDRPAIVNRLKSDGWHEHHNVPLNKDCPAAPFVHQLLRHATMTINEVEEKKVKEVLLSKGITDYDEHFLHNKEYWYKRVRMPPRCRQVSQTGRSIQSIYHRRC